MKLGHEGLGLFMSVRNATFCQIVGGQFEIDAVAHQYPDAITAHATGNRGEHEMVSVVYLHFEVRVRLFVDNNADEFDQFLFHTQCSFSKIMPPAIWITGGPNAKPLENSSGLKLSYQREP